MGRRSPSNERYQKFTGPSGKTRKSAAAAKPKRAAGKSATSSSASKKSALKTKGGRTAYVHPTSPEYKRLRLIWWVFLGGSVVLSTAAFFMWRQDSLRSAGNYVLAAAYGFIFVAVYIDWAKLRPMRQEWMKSGQAAAEKDLDKSGKADTKS